MPIQVRSESWKVAINNYRSIIYDVFLYYFLFYCFLTVDNLFFEVHELRFVRGILTYTYAVFCQQVLDILIQFDHEYLQGAQFDELRE